MWQTNEPAFKKDSEHETNSEHERRQIALSGGAIGKFVIWANTNELRC
jgi:hypothetical protein